MMSSCLEVEDDLPKWKRTELGVSVRFGCGDEIASRFVMRSLGCCGIESIV